MEASFAQAVTSHGALCAWGGEAGLKYTRLPTLGRNPSATGAAALASSCWSLLCCSRHKVNCMVSPTTENIHGITLGTLPILFQLPCPQPHCCSSFEWLSQRIGNISEEPQSNPESLTCLVDWYLPEPSTTVLLPLYFKCIMKNSSWIKRCCQVYFTTVPCSWCAGLSLAGNRHPVHYSSTNPRLRHRILFQYCRLRPVDHHLAGHNMESTEKNQTMSHIAQCYWIVGISEGRQRPASLESCRNCCRWWGPMHRYNGTLQ